MLPWPGLSRPISYAGVIALRWWSMRRTGGELQSFADIPLSPAGSGGDGGDYVALLVCLWQPLSYCLSGQTAPPLEGGPLLTGFNHNRFLCFPAWINLFVHYAASMLRLAGAAGRRVRQSKNTNHNIRTEIAMIKSCYGGKILLQAQSRGGAADGWTELGDIRVLRPAVFAMSTLQTTDWAGLQEASFPAQEIRWSVSCFFVSTCLPYTLSRQNLPSISIGERWKWVTK